MQPQTTLIEKLILSALIAFVTAASATTEFPEPIENSRSHLASLILAPSLPFETF